MRAQQMSVLTFLAWFLLVVLITKALVGYVSVYLMRYVAERVMADVRDDLYGHLHSLSLGFFLRKNTGEIVSRVTADVDALGASVTDLFRNALREPFTIVGLIGVLFLIHWQLALASLVIFPVTVIPIVKFGQKIRRRGTRVLERRAELSTVLQEGITGVRIVQAFGKEDYERQRFRAKNHELFQAILRIVRVDSLSSPVMEILEAVGIVVAVWLGGWLVVRGELTPGAFMGFLGALASLYVPIKRLSAVNNNIQRGMAGVTRVFEILDQRPDVADRPGARVLPPVKETVDLRPRELRLRAGPLHPAGHSLSGEDGGDRGYRGRQRRRQEHAGKPAAPLLRSHGGPHPPGRCGPARVDAGLPPGADRRGDPRHDPLRRHRGQQHRIRAVRRRRSQPVGAERPRPDPGGGAPGQRRRVHPRAARRVCDPDRRERRPALRRAEAADCHCPGHPQGPAHPDPG